MSSISALHKGQVRFLPRELHHFLIQENPNWCPHGTCTEVILECFPKQMQHFSCKGSLVNFHPKYLLARFSKKKVYFSCCDFCCLVFFFGGSGSSKNTGWSSIHHASFMAGLFFFEWEEEEERIGTAAIQSLESRVKSITFERVELDNEDISVFLLSNKFYKKSAKEKREKKFLKKKVSVKDIEKKCSYKKFLKKKEKKKKHN